MNMFNNNAKYSFAVVNGDETSSTNVNTIELGIQMKVNAIDSVDVSEIMNSNANNEGNDAQTDKGSTGITGASMNFINSMYDYMII